MSLESLSSNGAMFLCCLVNFPVRRPTSDNISVDESGNSARMILGQLKDLGGLLCAVTNRQAGFYKFASV